jgi:hypothetical protein
MARVLGFRGPRRDGVESHGITAAATPRQERKAEPPIVAEPCVSAMDASCCVTGFGQLQTMVRDGAEQGHVGLHAMFPPRRAGADRCRVISSRAEGIAADAVIAADATLAIIAHSSDALNVVSSLTLCSFPDQAATRTRPSRYARRCEGRSRPVASRRPS